MLEPTAKTENSVSSKPIDFSANYESFSSISYEQVSTYASAESSPNNAMLATPDIRLIDEPCFPKSTTAESINTYWGLPPASSLLIDEDDKIDALNHSKEKLSMSQSMNFNNSAGNTQFDKEYQSLPSEQSKLDKTLEEEKSTEPGVLKKELSSSDLFKIDDVEGEEGLVSVDLKEYASDKSNQLPEMSIPKSKSSTFAFIEKIFSSTKAPAKVEETMTEKKEDLLTKHALIASAAASASSPNPECSPYKFLIIEYPAKSNEEIAVSSLKLELQEEKSENTNENVVVDKIIENLADLNRKESEKHDPILSSAKKVLSDAKLASTSVKKESQAKPAQPKSNASSTTGRSPSKSVSSVSSLNIDSSKVHHVPASSREFCMNLNLNLASAAAAKAGGPVVVVDNTNKSPVAQEHNKFTSNASTSSIHNDLKMILEESKEDKKPKSKHDKESKHDKLNKSNDGSKKDKLKSQRTKKDKENSKQNVSNSSFNSSATEQINADSTNLSPTSKSNNLNLIKMMMLMVEGNKSRSKNSTKEERQTSQEPSLIDLAKQNGRYKYTREFLMQIREQRASFIEQINPDIFKAYCYCMRGKYWDPEKYFDIVQFPGDFDRIPSNRNNTYNRSGSYNKTQSSAKYNKKNTPNSTFNNSHYKNNGVTPVAVPNMPDDSPQPLQVPKNSPKFENKENKKSPVHSILESLGLNTEHLMDKSSLDADKLLLGLIKKDKNMDSYEQSSNLMSILNKKTHQVPSQSSNILDNLFNQNQASARKEEVSHKHYPLILTAQELEMSQLNQEKLSKHKLPNEISMTKLEELQQSMESNDSFAYKQLVKNLSNHPLNSAASLNNKLEASLSKLQNKQNSKPSWQVSNDGTNILKQMLNLKTSDAKPEKTKSKSSKKTHTKSSKLSMSHGSTSGSSSTGSSPVDNSNKFPAANPHEKPFESFMAEENRKQIEQVVASALNQVLNKSPNSLKTMSPSPRSPIQELIEKISGQQREQDLKNTQQEHFNSLLSKMNQQKQENNQSDILRWFSDVNKNAMPHRSTQMSVQSLSEIEFMEMRRPQNALNPLF